MSDIYKDNGYESREDYLKGLAEELDIDESFVFMTADLLGPNEDFDGLVTMLSEYSM
jgi:hypothetical protein